MSGKPLKIETCMFCGREITRQRTPEGYPKFAWKSDIGFYCAQAGGDCWHLPKEDNKGGV